MKGKLLIFSAPSGAGKTTLVRCLMSRGLNLEFSVSATSRKPRIGERDGVDYFFLSVDEFRSKIEREEFTEWEEVYENHFYGTLKSEIERIWDNGNHVVFDVDVMGGLSLKRIFGERAASFFVMPPSIEVLEKRLNCRGTDSEDKIRMRLDKAEKELDRSADFDFVIINDDIERACDETEQIVRSFIEDKQYIR